MYSLQKENSIKRSFCRVIFSIFAPKTIIYSSISYSFNFYHSIIFSHYILQIHFDISLKLKFFFVAVINLIGWIVFSIHPYQSHSLFPFILYRILYRNEKLSRSVNCPRCLISANKMSLDNRLERWVGIDGTDSSRAR